MTDVKFKASSDFEKVKKDYEQLARVTAKVEAENQKLKRASQQSGDVAKRSTSAMAAGLQKATDQARGLALQYVGVGAALAAWNKHLQDNKRLAQEASAASMTLAQSQAAVIKNIGDVSNEATTKFLESVNRISTDAGLPSAVPLNMTASSVLSAVGGDQGTTLEILKVVSQLFRDQPDQMAPFGGAMGDVMKASGMNARQTAAFMLAAQGQARFENLEAFKEVAPALAAGSVVTRGDRVRNAAETAALFAGIGSRAGDVEGAVTKSAVANLAANLEEFVPELNTTFERLQYVRARPELQAEVLAAGGYRGPQVPIIRELLAGADTQTSQMVSDAFEKIKPDEEAFNRKVDQLMTLTPQLALSGAAQRATGNIEAFLTGSQIGLESEARRIMDETLDKTRRGVTLGTLQNMWSGHAYDLGVYGENPIEAASSALMERRANIAGRWDPYLSREAPLTAQEIAKMTDTQRTMVDLIERQLTILQQMTAQYQNNGRSRSAQQERVSQVAE